jgi:hypothetical protein
MATPRPARITGRNANPGAVYPGFGRRWILHLVIFVALVAATVVLYQPAVSLGFFNLDDEEYVVSNPHLRGPAGPSLVRILTQPYAANYSPTHLLSYFVDARLAGIDPRAFHLSSHLWAGAVAGFVYLLAVMLLGRWWCGLIAGALFVVHPAHVEAVAWISSRKDLVAAAFTLPAMAAYLQYRRAGPRARAWYAVSLVLFTFGLAGKLSVVVAPAILFLLDVCVERRRGWGLVLDKIPYGLIALFFALRTMGAQPPTRHQPDLFVIGHSFLQNLKLLSGWGPYVVMRPRPELAISPFHYAVVALAPFVLLGLPGLFGRRRLVTVLFYWVVLALIPSQVLSFVHPVADRYLFFPSVGLCLLLGWAAREAAGRRGRSGAGIALAGLAGLAAWWTVHTRSYLREWSDPRSVWYAAALKSSDLLVAQYLGSHYQDEADRIAPRAVADPEKAPGLRRLAEAVWSEDPRREALLAEWRDGKFGPVTREYQVHLRTFAGALFDRAEAQRKTEVVPNLYFRRGKLALDSGDPERARREFQAALQQAAQHTAASVRQELTVRSHHALALIEWRERNYPEAMRWLTRAEEQQRQFGGRWIPDIAQQRERLAGLINLSSGAPSATPIPTPSGPQPETPSGRPPDGPAAAPPGGS